METVENTTPPLIYKKFKEYWINFNNLGNISDLPISKILAFNLKDMKKIFDDYEAKIETMIDNHAKVDENGKWLGIEYEDKDSEGNAIKKRKDLSGTYMYDWIDVNDRVAFNKELDELINKPITNFKFRTIKSNKTVTTIVPKEFKDKNGETFVSNVEKEMLLIDVLEKKLPANFMVLLFETIIELIEENK